MATSTPSGLGSSVGFAAESTVGTATTASMRWLQHDKVTAEYVKGTVTSTGLHQGNYQQGKRRALLTKQAKLQLSMDAVSNKMGLLFQHSLGGTPTITQQAATAAWLQVCQPADSKGLGLTVQVGKPLATGTVQQSTYAGCKVTDWQLAVARGQLAKWDMTLDSWLEDTATAYASPSYVATNTRHFDEGSLLLGGTVTYPSSVVSVASGVVPTGVITDFLIKGVNPLKVDRFNLGSQVKSEQLSNNFRQITGSMTIEYAALADVYTAFTADTATAIHFAVTNPVAIASTFKEYIDVIVPQAYIDTVVVDVPGPDVIQQKVTFTALDDGTTAPIQIAYMSTDTAI